MSGYWNFAPVELEHANGGEQRRQGGVFIWGGGGGCLRGNTPAADFFETLWGSVLRLDAAGEESGGGNAVTSWSLNLTLSLFLNPPAAQIKIKKKIKIKSKTTV